MPQPCCPEFDVVPLYVSNNLLFQSTRYGVLRSQMKNYDSSPFIACIIFTLGSCCPPGGEIHTPLVTNITQSCLAVQAVDRGRCP